MKTIHADLLNCGTLVFGVRIQRLDGTVLGYTEHDRDAAVTFDVGGVETDTDLLANPGFNLQSLSSTAGLGVDNTDTYLIQSDDITRADILARKWDGAKVYFFRYNWKLPASGVIPVKRGSFGNLKPELGQFKVEFRDIRQALQPNSTWVFQETCRWRLGDNRCRIDLAPWTFESTVSHVGSTIPATPPVTGTLTGAVDEAFFGDSARAEAANYFVGWFFTFLSGPNAGLGRYVVSFAGGEFETALFPEVPEPGDAYSIAAPPVGAALPDRTFTAPSLTQADDFFGEGEVTWLTGNNAGAPGFKVKIFADSVVSLTESTIYPIEVGDTFRIVAGCRKRWQEDCKTKFDNLLNFGGEKDKPTRDSMVQTPEPIAP